MSSVITSVPGLSSFKCDRALCPGVYFITVFFFFFPYRSLRRHCYSHTDTDTHMPQRKHNKNEIVHVARDIWDSLPMAPGVQPSAIERGRNDVSDGKGAQRHLGSPIFVFFFVLFSTLSYRERRQHFIITIPVAELSHKKNNVEHSCSLEDINTTAVASVIVCRFADDDVEGTWGE